MGNVYKRGKTWYFDARIKGRLMRKKVSTSKKIAEWAKTENLTKLHTLRHTFASHLVVSGVDLPTVKN